MGFRETGVVSMVEDAAGDFWIGLGPSLMRIDPREFELVAADPDHQLRYRLYGARTGCQERVGRPGVPSVARTASGELLFVTSVGLAVVDPHRLRDRPPPTLIRVDGVSADGQSVNHEDDRVTVPARTARLVVNYSLLNLTGGKPRFRHKLEGFDDDWQDVGDRREASYTNLPPGPFTFRVSSRHEDAWIESLYAAGGDDPARRSIRPRPFRVTAASSLALLFWFGWRRRVRQIRREFDLVLAERSRVGREIHDTLLQSLVAVALEFDDISEQLDPAKAGLKAQVINIRTRVEQYILEARQTISNLRSPMLEQSDLGTALKRSGESATAPHGIRFEFALQGMPRPLDETLEEQLLRIGQEAVSNAVRHGSASTIHMELCFDHAAVRLRVSDDGCGFDPDQPARRSREHWGIAGMRERAERVGAQLRLVSQPGAGTTVEALVPLIGSAAEPWRRDTCHADQGSVRRRPPAPAEGVARKIERQPDMAVVDTAGTGQEAVMLYLRHRPDIVLMDLQMPGMGGLQAIEAIRREDPDAKIIVLTILGGDEDIYRAIHAGAASYLLKSSLSQDLIATVRRVVAGERPMPPEVAERLAAREGQSGLSAREIQILELIAKGLRNKEIAGELGIGQETVQTHIKRLFVKLQVSDRTAAVTVALRRGIVHMP